MKLKTLLFILIVNVTLLSCALLQAGTHGGYQSADKNVGKIVNMINSMDIRKTGDISRTRIVIAVPKNIEGKQEILDIDCSVKPEQILDDGTNTYYIFNFNNKNLPSKIQIKTRLLLFKCDYESNNHNIYKSNEDIDQNWLKAERYLETKNPELITIAQSLKRETYEDTVKAIFDFVCMHLRYNKYDPKDNGALWAYKKGYGDCTEYTDLFITLCRILNIPSRYNEGYTTRGSNLLHNWPEVYFPNIGWVYFDPMYRDNSSSTTYAKLSKNYISISKVRNDNNLNGYHYYCYNYSGSGVVSINSKIHIY